MGRIRALNVGLDGVVGGLWGVVGAGKMTVSVESEWYFFLAECVDKFVALWACMGEGEG